MLEILRATWDAELALEADDAGERRIITGVAVPYGEIGRTNLGPARFHAGALEPAATIVATRDHDPARLVGRVVDHASTDRAHNARIRVAATPLGDETLTLAGDGTLAGLSIDADPLEFHYSQDAEYGAVLEVTRAAWTGLSLVPRPAFAGARVGTVQAADGGDPQPSTALGATMSDTTLTLESTPAPAGSAMPAAPATLTAAEIPAVVPLHAAPAQAARPFGLTELARLVATHQGDATAIRAALVNVTTTEFAGLMRPQYVDDLTGLIRVGRPAVEAFAQRNLTGNPIQHPHWKTLGIVDVQAAEKTQVASGPAEIEWQSLPAVTYAGANDLSIQVIDWGSPSAIETYLSMMAEVYARKTEAVFETDLVAKATALPVGTMTSLVQIIGRALGMVAGTGLVPNLILASGDVWGALWTALSNAGPGLFSTTNTSFPTPRVVLLPFAPAATLIVGSSQAAVTYENQGAPVNVRVVEVSLLGYDLGVYGYFAETVDYPLALIKVTGTIPGSEELSSSAKK